MIFLIVPVIGIIIGIIVHICEWGWEAEVCLAGLIGGLIGLVVAVILWFGCALLPGAQPTVINTSDTEIHALVDNARYSSQVSGSVFLIQTKTEEKLKYSYMYMAEGKGYGFNEVDAKQAYINYTNETPHMVRQYIDCESAFLRWLLPDIYDDEYIFYLPEDAEVINDYVIDFE